MAIYN